MEGYWSVRDRVRWVGGCLLGFFGLGLLAMAAHAVPLEADAARLRLIGELWLMHAPVFLLAAGAPPHLRSKAVDCLGLGLLLFAMGLAWRILAGASPPLPLAPMGGALALLGWVWLGWAGLRRTQ